MNCNHFTPKGLNNPAQGKRSTALGIEGEAFSNPERVAEQPRKQVILSNPCRVAKNAHQAPRVAAASTLGCDVKPLWGNNLEASFSGFELGEEP